MRASPAGPLGALLGEAGHRRRFGVENFSEELQLKQRLLTEESI
jgi:hypothetical protein